MRCVRVEIQGRVQGVWYRGWTVQEAGKRGLDGWVRNRRDGSVEAVFSGPSEDVAAMIAACRTGPPMARVEDIRVMEDEPLPAQ
ncbi:MAG: acylphosphatase, partial [Rhodospirillales bacterium]|nr:acylphosphatase [Rhodospirillales bacterium]